MEAMVLAVSNSNSFYVNMDVNPDNSHVWQIPLAADVAARPVTSGAVIDPANPVRVFQLNAGSHQLIVRGREANTKLFGVTVSLNP